MTASQALESLAEIAEHASSGGERREDALAGLAAISKRGDDNWTPQKAETDRLMNDAKFIGGER